MSLGPSSLPRSEGAGPRKCPVIVTLTLLTDHVVASVFFSFHALSVFFSPQTYAVTEAVQKIAESHECKPIEGMLSHQLEQNTIDGEKTIIQAPSEAQRKEHDKYDFELHEVYAVDVLISTGEGQVSLIRLFISCSALL